MRERLRKKMMGDNEDITGEKDSDSVREY